MYVQKKHEKYIEHYLNNKTIYLLSNTLYTYHPDQRNNS